MSATETKKRERQSYPRLVWKQFRKDPVAIVGLFFVLALFVMAIFAPLIAGSKPVAVKVNGDLVDLRVIYKKILYFSYLSHNSRSWVMP